MAPTATSSANEQPTTQGRVYQPATRLQEIFIQIARDETGLLIANDVLELRRLPEHEVPEIPREQEHFNDCDAMSLYRRIKFIFGLSGDLHLPALGKVVSERGITDTLGRNWWLWVCPVNLQDTTVPMNDQFKAFAVWYSPAKDPLAYENWRIVWRQSKDESPFIVDFKETAQSGQNGGH
ncbi:hypothetical protein JX265_000433 [Neoarthrinium moseri]|uniref:Uncharacterized protein n=1 Tax=Neoarthrinium moseri TaxID=1658444 RepID=A0A9P9WYU9_9PEZI|nr:hypothetical protein JX266_003408 [Neoarthrinium moseri]KAI1881607.1 hypothetical protein JX265_000433 [Neoarthrinium moseri]